MVGISGINIDATNTALLYLHINIQCQIVPITNGVPKITITTVARLSINFVPSYYWLASYTVKYTTI